MQNETRRAVVLIGCLLVLAASTLAAEETPELELTPCTIELVDGTEVEGELAVQFDLPDHLIVYSPRLATVRSFLKDHVHALVVDGKREELNPKRELTDEDTKLLGQLEWPDEPPAEGRKPAYTTETWEQPKRLMVWARPGKSGRFSEPGNWLRNGRPATTLGKTEIWSGPSWHRGRSVTDLDKDTDILMPVARGSYSVRDRGGSYLTRHITVETNASLHRNLNSVYGNLWVAQEGDLDGGGNAVLRGAKHTFFVNGRPLTGGPPATPEEFSKLMKSAKHFARKWIVRKDDAVASITLIGSCRSGDETHWVRGVTILDENTVVSIGGRCSQTIGRDATFIMKSGSVLGKNGNQLYKDDMRLKGAFLIGTPEEPITRNCYLGLSIKDSGGTYPKSDRMPDPSGFRLNGTSASTYGQGLTMAPHAKFAVHSANPGRTKLVITWHGITDTGSDDGTKGGYFDEIAESERTTNMVFLGDVRLTDVTLDWFGEGDIRMLNPDARHDWERIGYGEHSRAEGDALFRKLSLSEEASRELAKYREEAEAGGGSSSFYAGMTLYTRNPGTPTIETPAGHYPEGEPVTVRLSNETLDIETRYTLDGSAPSASSKLYEAPFAIREDAVIQAGGFKDGKQLGDTAEAEIKFIGAGDMPLREAGEPSETSPGLSYGYYEGEWDDTPDFDELSPKATGVATEVALDAVEHRRDNFAIVFEGWLDLAESGVHTFYVSTGKEDICDLYISGERVIANNKDQWTSWGTVGLSEGKHRIKVVYREKGWGERLRVQFRELNEDEKRDISAGMLSH